MELLVFPFVLVVSPTLFIHSRKVEERPCLRSVLLHELCPLLAWTHTRGEYKCF